MYLGMGDGGDTPSGLSISVSFVELEPLVFSWTQIHFEERPQWLPAMAEEGATTPRLYRSFSIFCSWNSDVLIMNHPGLTGEDNAPGMVALRQRGSWTTSWDRTTVISLGLLTPGCFMREE